MTNRRDRTPPPPITLRPMTGHDLAVHPRAHGQGLGRRLALTLFGAARSLGLGHGALVAVLDARPFWERLGFAAAAPGQGGAVLASYPGQAVYMCRRIDA